MLGGVYLCGFTHHDRDVFSWPGEMITFFAPAVMDRAFAASVSPVHSITFDAELLPRQRRGLPDRQALDACPLTDRMCLPPPRPISCSPLRRRTSSRRIVLQQREVVGWHEIVDRAQSSCLPSNPCSTSARNTNRPMRPNPLIPILTAAIVECLRCRSTRRAASDDRECRQRVHRLRYDSAVSFPAREGFAVARGDHYPLPSCVRVHSTRRFSHVQSCSRGGDRRGWPRFE